MKPRNVISYLVDRLGEDNLTLIIRGVEYDLRREVAIPRAGDADLDDVLYDHVERKAAWEMIVAHATQDHIAATEAFEEAKQVGYGQVWNTFESQERKELEECLLDEDEVEKDMFRRRKAVQDRLASGPKVKVRWRRNFTDERVWSWVHQLDEVSAARKKLATAKATLDMARVVLNTLDHRMRCLSHICARDRDNRS